MVLCENGDDVAVTVDNLREYVQAYVDCILSTSVEKQVGVLQPSLTDSISMIRMLYLIPDSPRRGQILSVNILHLQMERQCQLVLAAQ